MERWRVGSSKAREFGGGPRPIGKLIGKLQIRGEEYESRHDLRQHDFSDLCFRWRSGRSRDSGFRDYSLPTQSHTPASFSRSMRWHVSQLRYALTVVTNVWPRISQSRSPLNSYFAQL